MPKCINDPKKRYKGDEPSPKGLGYSASAEEVGKIMIGLDNNNWIVVTNKNMVKRWKKTNILIEDETTKILVSVDAYEQLRAFKITDHIIHQYNKGHPAYFITYSNLDDGEDDTIEISEILKKLMLKIDYKRLEHPNSSGKVWDLIHPSHYPYISGITKDGNDVNLIDKYENDLKYRREHFYLSRHQMKKSNFKWIPTIYHVKKTSYTDYEIEQKSYINDLFIEDKSLKLDIEKIIGKVFVYSFSLFCNLAENMDLPYDYLLNKDLQVIVKSSYYELKPGETHEGVWHVEGMPDEHIIMASIYYYQDDFNNAKLEFRRDVSDKEEDERIMLLPQNTNVDYNDSLLQEHLGVVNTIENTIYAWPNSCQHRLLPLINESSFETKKRSFIAFFLIDPDIKCIDTSMVKPQNQYISDLEAVENMTKLMEERHKVKIELNHELEEEISYCEH